MKINFGKKRDLFLAGVDLENSETGQVGINLLTHVPTAVPTLPTATVLASISFQISEEEEKYKIDF